jgi:Ca2+-binding EF-hand superfamily protein
MIIFMCMMYIYIYVNVFVDKDALSELFDTYDTNKNGAINLDELEV